MSKTFDQGKEEVAKLCQYFATNRQAFLAPGIKEAHIRQSLIDPFFESLGWDVRNTAMVAPQYREVIPEDSLDVEGQQKAPDYTFRVGPQPKFYTEAKKCGVNINADPGPAYQLRRYGWSAKVALSILTDFEELGVYDCTSRPRPSDKASRGRIQYFRFEEYPDRWRELWDVFSREAVWSGAFDQYAASKRKRGTSEVDVEFLREIEGWRDALARNIALRNKDLSSDDLNAAVQRTIDRVVFLRMAEDRGIEPDEQLLKLCERPDIYPRFMRDLCRRADRKYNSGLFHFQKESGVSEEPDRITPALAVDDKVFKPILQSLYFAHGCPYHFGVLPVEILGTVYERFLGKVIRLTAGHQAKVEEKPEVRKAGGVYYTPAYIVDYIVKQTVGRQIEGKSPAQLAGGKDKPPLRVLDMACGSGSFLVGAYRCLLDHCLKWYIEHRPATHPRAVYKDPRTGECRFTVEEKKRILTTHIFGVDIDPQAVEVSKLSLLLKVLEGETEQSLQLGLLPFSDRALPNLADNIKCGNSLIGPDYFTGKLIPDPDEIKRINPFDWQREFPQVFPNRERKGGAAVAGHADGPLPDGRGSDQASPGGFDCIIGNPPYVLLQDEFRDNMQLDYFRSKFASASFKIDTYHLFIEQGINLSNTGGRFSMITPANILTNNHLDKLRRVILERSAVQHIVIIDGGVFQGISVDNAVFVFSPGKPTSKDFEITHARIDGEQLIQSGQIKVSPARALEDEHVLFTGTSETGFTRLWKRITPKTRPLGDLADVNFGKQLRDRKKFSQDVIEVSSLRAIPHTHRPCYTGRDVNRYALTWGNLACLDDEVARSGGCWDARRHDAKNKLLTRQIGRFPDFAIDTAGWHCLNTMFMVNLHGSQADAQYVLGILNSKLMHALWLDRFYDQRRTFPKIKGTYLKQLPIWRINFSAPVDKSCHDRMGSLVDSMLALHKQLAAAKSETQKAVIQRQIAATDADIDRLVYDLYGLTTEEIAIVEGKEG